ncbi:ead/Ea22-like family protein [Salmonella enterica]|nr:ead/Ea22-like family protein [Salmonella enterica]
MESMAEGMIKDLVASGHALADDMTGAPSVLVRCLAAQLEVQLVRANALAAENAGLKKSEVEFNDYCRHECEDVGDTWVDDFTETPATDAFLAEVRAQAHKEGAYFVANRMLAAWDAGFIDDTAKNAADIARMILTSTEFMADAPEGDFDRSFADGVLEGIAAQLRKGVQS